MIDTYYKPHVFALEILKKLSTNKGLRFNQLLIPELESEHMNYHLKKLVENGYVKKEEELYKLTNKGKDYIGMLDDNKEIIEKQPKVSVLLNVRRTNEKGEVEHLLSRRLEHPYLNKVGRLGGKIRFGEVIEEAALRELYEETGLSVDKDNCMIVQVYHKLRWGEDGTPVQDNVFFICSITNPIGNFIPKTPVQENIWVTKKEFETSKDIDPFDNLTLNDTDDPNHSWFTESKEKAQGY